jgi:hypothetical protein
VPTFSFPGMINLCLSHNEVAKVKKKVYGFLGEKILREVFQNTFPLKHKFVE